MHRLLTVGLLLVAVSLPASADEITRLAIGQVLPPLEGDFLTKEKARLPDAAAGKVALVTLGFTYDSRFAVEEWSKRFRETFAEEPRVTFFEVPMLGRMARLGRVFIDRGMRNGTPEAFHGNVITVYGGSVGDWKKRMGFTDAARDAAYLILLDPDGTVRWLHTGVPADDPFEALVAATRDSWRRSRIPRSGPTLGAGPVAGQPTGAQAQERDHGRGPCAPVGARPAPPARL